ncbi:hemagglutinin repeat-containing protein [Buttiauxella gaviniae]|uniref:Hemagglutinin repeat-containing protein n=1 Tax=Buttiauxella gaviniae TaxID=82990 RepID=A0ABV3NUP7_9ENTR
MENQQPPVHFVKRQLSYLICILLAGQPVFPAFAAPTPANNATQMDQAGNGVPVVNIATPNGAGISHNQFQDYNVGKEGIILNNATGQLNPTQLGGLIQNNPNLKAGQEARAIINEVTGANRSQLQGYTEVAGKAANVMVANPYGITCNGCGFINTPNATLTTGKPVFDASGNLQQLDVTKGSITLEGQGLDGSQTDALSIISRATEINAGIHAKDLKVIAGANRVGADGRVTAIAGEGAAPVIAVDTGALGCMYANRIHLVSSDKGVGVNLGNLNARQGDITLDANGKLTVKNSLASGNLTAKGDSIALSGEHKAGGALSVSGVREISINDAQLASDSDISLNSQGQISVANGSLTAAKNLSLAARDLAVDQASRGDAAQNITATLSGTGTTQGHFTAGQNLSVTGKTLTNSGQLAANGDAQISLDTLTNSGTLQTGGQLAINAKQAELNGTQAAKGALNIWADSLTHGGKSNAAAITLTGNQIANSGILVAPALTINSAALTNSGLLQGNQALNLSADRLDNRFGGTIYSEQNLALNIPTLINAGLISSDRDLFLGGNSLTNSGEINAANLTSQTATLTNQVGGLLLADEQMTIGGQTLDNAGQLAANLLTINTDTFANRSVMQGDGGLAVTAKSLVSQGQMLSGAELTLNADSLNTSGLIQGKTLNLASGEWINTGNVLSEQNATINVRHNLSNQGKILGQQGVKLTAGALENRGWLAATVVTFQGDLINSGLIQGSDSLVLTGNSLNNQETGQWLTGGEMALSGQTLANQGVIQGNSLQLNTGQWSNSGKTQALDALTAHISGAFTNSGAVLSQNQLTLNAADITNSGSLAAQALSLITASLNNDGRLQGNTSLALDASSISNLSHGQIVSGGALNLSPGSLDNTGLLQVNDDFILNGEQFSNRGTILANNLLFNLNGALTNEQEGQLLARQNASFTSGTLNNSGVLYSQSSVALHANTLSNSGKMMADDLTLEANTFTNSGLWQGISNLSATGEVLNISATGRVLSGGALNLNAGQLTTAGTVQGGQASVTADSWQNSGSLLGTDSVNVNVSGELSNTGDLLSQGKTQIDAQTLTNSGSLLSEGNMVLTSATLDNRGALQGKNLGLRGDKITNTGTMIGLDSLTLESRLLMAAPLLELVNGGQILTGGTLAVNGGSLTNSGTWQGQNILLSAQQLQNSGAIQSADALTLTLSDRLNSDSNSKITANGNATLQALSLTNGGQWLAKNLTLKGDSLNNAGDISGVDGLTVTLTGAFTQQADKTLLTAGKLTLDAASVDNQGRIQAGDLTVNTGQLVNGGRLQGANALALNLTGRLTNSATGSIISQQSLNITTPELFNYGLIQSGTSARINAAQSARNEGRTLAGGELVFNTASLINNGWLQAGQLTLNAATAVNGGTLLAEQQGTFTGNSLTNSGTAQGNNLALNYQQLTNAGTVLGTSSLNISAGQVNLQAAGKLFSGGNLLLTSTGFDQLGQVVALGDLTLKLTHAFTGQNVLAAGNTLNVISDGAVTNQSVMQGQAVNLTAGGALTNNGQITTGNGSSTLSGSSISMNAAGTLQAGGDVALNSRSNITVNGFTGTAGSLTLNAVGNIMNTALLYAGNNMSLLANSIRNNRGDILAGNNLWMQRDAAGNANAEVVNTSGNIETVNGDITIKTGHLLNERDGLEVTQTESSLPQYSWVTDIEAQIPLSYFKAGEYGYVINSWESGGGSPGHGAAPTTHYSSTPVPYLNQQVKEFSTGISTVTVMANGGAARISAGHDIDLYAGHLDNQASLLLANNNVTLSGNYLNNQSWFSGSEIRYQTYQYGFGLDEVPIVESTVSKGDITSKYIVYSATGEARYERGEGEIYRSVIQAGGNVVANFTNDISNTTTTANTGGITPTIAAPTLNTLSNQTIDSAVQKQNLAGNDSVAINSPEWNDQLQNALQQINGGSGLDTSGSQLSGLDNANLGDATALNNASAQGSSLNTYQPHGVDTSAYPLPSGQNGYFVTSTDPNSPYLITTNPKLDGLGKLDQSLFGDLYALMGMTPGEAPRETNATYTDQNKFLGSSYFLERLNLHPEYDYRFLGDAAFDTRYVSNFILNQTGSRYINGIGSDLAQMQYLMDNAANAQRSLGLQFGIALTHAQIAALDQSILWWEAATVNGQTVMIPKVYLSAKDVTVNNGSVISGNNVQLAGGNITNSGSTIAAQNGLSIDSANSISNLNAGLMQAGGDLQLSALGDINNIGSQIAGKTVALESLDGNINNITLTEQWQAGGTGKWGQSVSFTDTLSGPTAGIVALDSLSLFAGNDINITDANVAAGGDLVMQAWGDIAITANQITDADSQSGFRGKDATSSSSVTYNGSTISAGGSIGMQAGNDLTVEASQVSAGENALLIAGNDLNLNAAETRESSGKGKRETHSTDNARSTITAGDDLTLVAGRDINSHAAGLAAEGDVAMQAGRDVNLLAEETTEGDSYRAKKKVEINESVRQDSTEIASGGEATIVAGRDVNSAAAQVTANGDIGIAAGRDINLSTATESDYHFKEETKTKSGFLNKTTTHTIEEDSATREAGTLLSGDNVTLAAGNNLLVEGSAVVGDGDVSLNAGNNIDIIAATDTDSTYRFKEQKKSGLMGNGGIGVTIGTNKSRYEMNDEGTTQSQSFSTIGSTGGDVTLNAGGQAHIGGADIIAGKDLSITGDSVLIEPGRDRRTHDESFEQKSSGLTIALSGAAGSAVNGAVTAAQSANEESDDRLAALKIAQAAMNGVQADQAMQLAEAGGENGSTAFGISASIGSQSSKSSSHSEQNTATGSTLTAGDHVSITATGGDITAIGSQIKAGLDVTLDAANDINLISSQNTQLLEGDNESHGGSLGIGIGVGNGGAGINISASGNSSRGNESGNGTTQNETTIDAGNRVTIHSGDDTTIAGAQVSGNSVVADIGGDLTISSLQDSDRYDSSQNSISGGASFSFGTMTGSGGISFSKDKMHSDYDSVIEQSGIFAGDGGFDITVGGHTQLDGGVIASTGTADKNSLDTGTLGFSDIGNKAEYDVSHSGAGISTGGSVAENFIGNMANGLPVVAGGGGSAEGTTKAAISAGSITIRDTENKQQDVADLSRDVEHANGSISPIFDKEKEQKRLEIAQSIGEVGSQAMDIARTEGQIQAITAGKAELEAKGKKAPAKDAPQNEWAEYNKALTETTGYRDAQKKWGTGSDIQQGLQAATAALQGLAGGDIAAAIAGGAAPYLAEQIHNLNLDEGSRAVAHVILGGVMAELQSKSAAAGAAGAVTGELIAQQLYPGRKPEELTEQEKQKVVALSTLAAGLAGGLVGDSTASAIAGAQEGKNSVSNNLFGGNEESQAAFIRQHGIDMATCEIAPSSASCQKAQNEASAVAGAMATAGLVYLPGGMQVTAGIGGTANAGIQYAINGTVNPTDVLIATYVGAFTANTGFIGTVGWNAAGGATSNYLKGDDPLTGAGWGAAGSAVGYGIGNKIVLPALDKVFNPAWKNYAWVDMGMGISKPLPLSPVPGMAGTATSSFATESTGQGVPKSIDELNKGSK